MQSDLVADDTTLTQEHDSFEVLKEGFEIVVPFL